MSKLYNCPDCHLNIYSCDGCYRLSTPSDPYTTPYPGLVPTTDLSNNQCAHCNNNPKNGGSGVCFCTLGSCTTY